MNSKTKIDEINVRLLQSTDSLEKYHLLTEIASEYKKMWKLNKALEFSQEALKISNTLLQNQTKNPLRNNFTLLTQIW